MLRITQIKLSIQDDVSAVKLQVAKKLKIKPKDILSLNIYKESIDARKRGEINFIYTVDVTVADEHKFLTGKFKHVAVTPDLAYQNPKKGDKQLTSRPVVVGFGPAGMYAALLLAQMGYKPLVLERGEAVDERVKSIDAFWQKGKLNPKSNVQFGEGGAGTFSDGKLTSRVKDLRGRKVLTELVNAGAPEEILYKAHPHVGTDLLRDIVKNIRKEIIKLGGEVRFNTQVKQVNLAQQQLKSLTLNSGEVIEVQQAIFAIGHSARDTFGKLYEAGVMMTAKPFAVGVRVEHPQTVIDKAQYKEFAVYEFTVGLVIAV